MDPPSTDDATESGKIEVPSCLGCRRRKLRCSREQPECAHCKRLESPCVYDLAKGKPGIKAGAVGSLTRRVEALEQAVQKGHGCCQGTQDGNGVATPSVVEVLQMLTTELRKLPARPPQPQVANYVTSSPTASFTSSRNESSQRSNKRRRLDGCRKANLELLLPLEEYLGDVAAGLPPPEIMELVIETYFDILQPWIPILHETEFRHHIEATDHSAGLTVILHAMVVAALRYASGELTAHAVEQQISRSRKFVVLTAMDMLSVENLQALVLVALTDIGNGDASKAWSLVGSLTRTVEYMRLSVESDDATQEPLLKPLPTVAAPRNWLEEEERRRVFWTIFCLDRFCSVTTGWNTSLTSSDVRRRLPADGGLWHKGESVTTPYFGIWDKSVAKIGNSIAFLPSNYPNSLDAPPNRMDMTTIGAFAYRVEATESLSRITTYFLQQNVNFRDKVQVGDWLTRFKELDLRLVHWKMFLPQRWKDSNVSRQPDLVTMDPNLTLAHVTHNTSMILLHQRIAYPDSLLANTLRLPSFFSAEACQVAAVETASITKRYLDHTPQFSPVITQFAFCVYVSARALLIHSRHYKADLANEFWSLVNSLDEMAKRWAGPLLQEKAPRSQAGKYADHLRTTHACCESNPQYVMDALGYACGIDQAARSPYAFGVETYSSRLSPNDGLSTISHMLIDQNFMAMDRIISLDDMMFTVPESSGNGEES